MLLNSRRKHKAFNRIIQTSKRIKINWISSNNNWMKIIIKNSKMNFKYSRFQMNNKIWMKTKFPRNKQNYNLN